ncbi:GtrA family protein [Ampullimonas aquatilis]|uniref:GtrA family protein n=1 Tax=Ampullimonas aquatilis TaxID=1341549 RepID=UPI003C726451
MHTRYKFMRWVRFLAVGTLNTGVTLGLYYLLQEITYYQIAYTIAYGIGILISYYLNTTLVFKEPVRLKSLATYPLVYLTQYLLSALFLSLFIEIFNISTQIGPILVSIIMIPITYLMSRWVLTNNTPTKYNNIEL